VTLLVLGGGYAASQYAVFTGTTESYAKKIDSPQTQLIALAILVAAIVLALLPNKEADEK
jgi:hypothetical protein